MPTYDQENRLIAIHTPLGENVLLLSSISGHEGISQLFEFDLDLLSERKAIAFKDIVGKPVTLKIRLQDESFRYVNGFASRFAQRGADQKFTHYRMKVVPWLWFLTRNADCRIFQNMTIPDIIQKVFTAKGFNDFRLTLTATYDVREYCVQYRETDFNFVSRLMEHHGIFYYFEHGENKHTLVLADSPSVLSPCPKQPHANYNLTSGDFDDEDVIVGWQAEQELRTGKYAVNDYNFEKPSMTLLSSDATVVQVGDNGKLEMYDYPGDYINSGQGKTLARIRMQEQEASHLLIAGSSVCRAFLPGYTFELREHYAKELNGSYLLTGVQHTANVGGTYSLEGGDAGSTYSNQFTCIPGSVPFRPDRVTRKPFVQGPQTALVVGKSGEEIWVDQYGRVKVQFYWDRVGKKNQDSSCWIRVSQPWAGKNWGAMWVPRMGQEVIVSFLEGDPDRPIITGRVYNAEQMVPYTLPDNQTISTFKSRSSKGGEPANYNEIRLEDKKGSEQIFINAERDMDVRVEVDAREFVGEMRHLKIGKDDAEQIGENRHLTIGKNKVEKIGADSSLAVASNVRESIGADKHLSVSGNMTESVGGDVDATVGGNRVDSIGSSHALTVGANRTEAIGSNLDLTIGSNRTETVGSNLSLTVGSNTDQVVGQNYALMAGQNITVQGGMNVVIEANMQITLSVPGSFITLGPSGIAIQGTMVMINSGGAPGSGSSANAKTPKRPAKPKSPKKPDDPTLPQVADDGTKYGELS